MGFFSVALAGAAAWLFARDGQSAWMWASIAVTVGCLWSYGLMHNYATNQAAQRRSYKGGFFDFLEDDLDAVPDWLTWINMGFALAALVALIGAAIASWL